MITYSMVGTNNFTQAKEFYNELLAALGIKIVMETPRAALYGTARSKTPMFGVICPFNKEPATAGNGNMVALSAGSRALVDQLHAKALSLGAQDEGAPGERLPGLYIGYFRDLDGNKMACTHMG